MIDFDVWLDAQDRKSPLRISIGFTFYFSTQTMHVWPGVGSVAAPDRTFEGANAVGTIKGLEIGLTMPKQTTTIELSGLKPEYFALAANQADEVRGRKAEVYFLGFGTGVKGEEWVLAAMSLEATREMDKMQRTIDYDAQTSTIILTMEPIGVIRWRAANGLLTHDDQQARYPAAGDLALERGGLVQFSRPLIF